MVDFALLIGAHLVGDFVLQNQVMAEAKASDSFICFVHVNLYMVPFCLLSVYTPISDWMYLAIAIQHFLQDRFALHLRWMAWFEQSPPDKWPTGPLCVDQAMHIGFIWLCVLLGSSGHGP